MPEGLYGMIGLLDDVLVALVVFVHIAAVYRTILLSWDRARIARAAATAAAAAGRRAPGAAIFPAPAVPAGSGFASYAGRLGLAAFCAVVMGAIATMAGAGAGAAALVAGVTGVMAAARLSDDRAIPLVGTDW